MTKRNKYQVTYPTKPGLGPDSYPVATLRDARRLAALLVHRRDLVYQDVRIERPDGRLVEYAGPCR